MNEEKLARTVAVLANLNDVTNHIIRNIMGNEISSTLGDSLVSKALVYELVQSRIRTTLAKYI